MASHKRTAAQREQHLAMISAMYLKGKPQADIAQALGVSQQQVSYDLKTLQARWQEAALADLDARKAEQLAKVDQLEREYWNAWERSLQPAETTQTEQTATPVGSRNKAVLKRENQTGDPRYLEGVRWCISERAKILGLNAPEKHDMTSGGKPIKQWTNDELLTYITSRIGRLRGEVDGGGATEPPASS